ncbi:MAG TPA: tRNA lysidine(34) synthetase TilS [Woeseiaceae bacterium]
MTFDAAQLRQRLADLVPSAGSPARYVVAFSGGLDSSVLAHALASNEFASTVPIVAVHIDHGLHPDAADWAQHCAEFAQSIGIEYRSRRVAVQLESGQGPEAAAREARYSALFAEIEYGDWLLSAHHREDQAETLLLNLVRGSGPAGIAGIGSIRRFGPGWLARPLLGVDRAALVGYAQRHDIAWLEDPSNRDRRFDRNFLRHDVLPRLATRWPDIAARLQRSASHAGEAAMLLADLAEIDLGRLGGDPARLDVEALGALSKPRQRNVIRHALRRLGLSTPTTIQLERVVEELVPARSDAQPEVSWPGATVRRYRGAVYLLSELPEELPESRCSVPGSLSLGQGLGVLEFEENAPLGLSDEVIATGLQVRRRAGGEEIRPTGDAHTRKLKKLLQDAGVVPWMRDRLPLLYAGDRLVAVGDLWIAAEAVSEPGTAVHWRDRPALY